MWVSIHSSHVDAFGLRLLRIYSALLYSASDAKQRDTAALIYCHYIVVHAYDLLCI